MSIIDPASILLVEDLDREHLLLVRGPFRADAIEVVWHLDLPDVKERAEIWDLAARRHGITNPGFDQVILARASHEFTSAEIHAAYARAARTSRQHAPAEGHLFDAMLGLQRLVDAGKEDLLRLTYWARRCVTPARGG